MLQSSRTRVGISKTFEIQSGVSITQEGIPLVGILENGKTKAAPCAGAAGEVFLGFSHSRNTAVDRMVVIGDFKVGSNSVLETPYAFIANQLKVVVGGNVLTPVSTAPAATEYKLVNNTLTFHSSLANAVATISGAYVPTYTQSVTAQGQGQPGGAFSAATGIVSTIRSGTVSTDRFDPTADWSIPTVRLGANGLLTTSGTGVVIPFLIDEAPSGNQGFLTLVSLNG